MNQDECPTIDPPTDRDSVEDTSEKTELKEKINVEESLELEEQILNINIPQSCVAVVDEPLFTTPTRLIKDECPTIDTPRDHKRAIDSPTREPTISDHESEASEMAILKEVNHTVESLEDQLAR